ncbi:MAG TPA: response regulator [Candidatus Saccharimonadales bacterium]|nr:response regulator [Candidatus Saccharimonadales bacterium]
MNQPTGVPIILLVEDSPDDVFFFHRAVTKSKVAATTHVAIDGVEAINYLQNQGRFADRAAFPQPDIIFLDLKLPHLNGFEVLEWIGRQPQRPAAPVIILTSSSEPEDRERAETLGAALFLTKPPLPEQLSEILGKINKC